MSRIVRSQLTTYLFRESVTRTLRLFGDTAVETHTTMTYVNIAHNVAILRTSRLRMRDCIIRLQCCHRHVRVVEFV